ncbi:hypothetical protein M0802_002609 [Mischocyttarus mexicanus]|nr:hypothetical protein M0802_002609 [Mischocyttarus mexicanus]
MFESSSSSSSSSSSISSSSGSSSITRLVARDGYLISKRNIKGRTEQIRAEQNRVEQNDYSMTCDQTKRGK